MLAMVGAVTSGSTPAPAMFSRQSNGPKEMVVLLHRWWGAAFGAPRLHRENFSVKGLDVPPGDEL
jgi:hypothetical protein